MSDKIKKITIRIELDGSAEEEKNLMSNVKLIREVIMMITNAGLAHKVPEFAQLPIALFVNADFQVVRIEPDTQTSQAE